MREIFTYSNRVFSVEFYAEEDGGYTVELWEDNNDQCYWYGADFLTKENALEHYEHVKTNVQDFID